ncbi:MAG: hypothetical protein AVDCRST_MAG07-1311, partial [uncultured Frankineae bacterium]
WSSPSPRTRWAVVPKCCSGTSTSSVRPSSRRCSACRSPDAARVRCRPAGRRSSCSSTSRTSSGGGWCGASRAATSGTRGGTGGTVAGTPSPGSRPTRSSPTCENRGAPRVRWSADMDSTSAACRASAGRTSRRRNWSAYCCTCCRSTPDMPVTWTSFESSSTAGQAT